MPKPQLAGAGQRLTAWSFSRFHTWRECPQKAKFKFILKLKEPDGPAMAKGNAVHKLAEDYAMGKLKQLPKELATFEDEFKLLRKHKKEVVVEQQWALSNTWAPTGWFDSDAWCRVILDAAHMRGEEADVIDHKTGKVYPYHEEQLSLNALATFMQDPGIKVVHTKLWYLDQGVETKHTYTLADVPSIKKEWEKKVKPMLADGRFAPNPGQACRYCHFKKSNQGPCEHS